MSKKILFWLLVSLMGACAPCPQEDFQIHCPPDKQENPFFSTDQACLSEFSFGCKPEGKIYQNPLPTELETQYRTFPISFNGQVVGYALYDLNCQPLCIPK